MVGNCNNRCNDTGGRDNDKFLQLNIGIEIPPQKSAREPQSAITACPYCGGFRVNLVKMPESCIHYSARHCAICDSFLGWEAKPETKEKIQEQQKKIRHLLKLPQLTQQERRLLEGLGGKKLSPRQGKVLTQIEAQLGGAQ